MEFDCFGEPIKEVKFWLTREGKLMADVELYIQLENGSLFPWCSHKRLLASVSQSIKAQDDRINKLFKKYGIELPKPAKAIELTEEIGRKADAMNRRVTTQEAK